MQLYKNILERITGLEPATRLWKSRMLPLHYIRTIRQVLNLALLDSNKFRLKTRTSLHLSGLPLPFPSPVQFQLSYVDGDQQTMVIRVGFEPAQMIFACLSRLSPIKHVLPPIVLGYFSAATNGAQLSDAFFDRGEQFRLYGYSTRRQPAITVGFIFIYNTQMKRHGGASGIRTHGRLITAYGFQDRSVMTTSVSRHIWWS